VVLLFLVTWPGSKADVRCTNYNEKWFVHLTLQHMSHVALNTETLLGLNRYCGIRKYTAFTTYSPNAQLKLLRTGLWTCKFNRSQSRYRLGIRTHEQTLTSEPNFYRLLHQNLCPEKWQIRLIIARNFRRPAANVEIERKFSMLSVLRKYIFWYCIQSRIVWSFCMHNVLELHS
jgi:hypothetical protein